MYSHGIRCNEPLRNGGTCHLSFHSVKAVGKHKICEHDDFRVSRSDFFEYICSMCGVSAGSLQRFIRHVRFKHERALPRYDSPTANNDIDIEQQISPKSLYEPLTPALQALLEELMERYEAGHDVTWEQLVACFNGVLRPIVKEGFLNEDYGEFGRNLNELRCMIRTIDGDGDVVELPLATFPVSAGAFLRVEICLDESTSLNSLVMSLRNVALPDRETCEFERVS